MVLVIIRFRPDVVHSYTPKAGLVNAVAAWLCRVPHRVHTFTGLIFPTRQGIMQQLLIRVDRLICQLCTRVVPEGDGVRGDLERFGVTNKLLKKIGNGNIAGVDLGYFDPDDAGTRAAAADLAATFNERYDAVFCYVGRINLDKGIGELIAAFTRLSLEKQVLLLVVGDYEKRHTVAIDVRSALHDHQGVRMLGFLEDIRPVLLASDCLVLPSYREGFPNVVLQAGAMAKPAIVTDISGCNEIIECQFNGLLVPPRNSVELYEALKLFTSFPSSKQKELGRAARKRVFERFERQAYLQKLLEFYRELSA
jgi:glycosyltransferase involved in cell wall biosynthesis